MNYHKALAENTTARLDAMRDLRELKDRIPALESQWDDLSAECRETDILRWLSYMHPLEKDANGITAANTVRDWEGKNPEWMVIRGSIRRRRTTQPNSTPA
jgi:hypothetical protein